jgi:Zn-dependent protease
LFDPIRFVYFALSILVGLTIHEASHALVADRLGDPTARRLGRITLNPIAHLDPTGALMMVFAAIAGIGIGWAKPVPVNPSALRPNPKTGYGLVAAAGPTSNLLVAILLVVLLGFIGQQGIALPSVAIPGGGSGELSVSRLIVALLTVNVSLALFNLIPIPPLDGFSVLLGLLPTGPSTSLSRLYRYGPPILLLLVFFGSSLLRSYFDWGWGLFDSIVVTPVASVFGLQ